MDDVFHKRRSEFREKQKATEQQLKEWEQLGMETLQPHLPVLLKALEKLFQQRRTAELADVHAAETGDAAEEEKQSDGEEAQENQANASGKRLLGVVRLKELQLLTRIAHCASDGRRAGDANANEEAQGEARRGLSVVSVPGPLGACPGLEGNRPTAACTGTSSVECRLIRLLLQSLPIGSSQAKRMNSRMDSVAVCRLHLTLQTLRRLTLPLAAQVRAVRTAQMSDATPSPKGGDFTSSTGSSSVLSDLTRVVRLIVSTCSRLLQHISVLSCRAATAELLVAAEFAACGLPHSEETLFYIRKAAATLVADESGVGNVVGDVADDGATLEARGERLLRILTPGGPLFNAVIEKATETSTSASWSGSARESECRSHQSWQPLLPSILVTAGVSTPPARGDQLAREPGKCVNTGTCTAEGHCRAVAQAEDSPRGGVGEAAESQWRVTAALAVLLLNTHRHQTASNAGRPAFLDADEEQPDTDMQLFVLSALAARSQGPPSCARSSRATLLEAWLSVSALEPVVCQCLFLLGASAVEWPVQQASLTVLKAAVDMCCNIVTHGAPSAGDLCLARSLLRVLGQMVVPFCRLQLKRPEEAQNRIGLQILDYVIRRFSPITCSLLSLSEEADTQGSRKHLRQLQQAFHVDLAVLLPQATSPPFPPYDANNPNVNESSIAVDQVVPPDFAGRAMKTQAQDEGGDFFNDLLHMQRHRRGRALQRLAQAVGRGLVGATTIRLVCLPICISCLLQRSSCASYTAGNRKGNLRREVFSQGLATHAIACLETCCRRLRWIVSLRTVQILCGLLARYPEREMFLFRALCAVVRAFEARARAAVNEALHSADTPDLENVVDLRRAKTSAQEVESWSERPELHDDEQVDENGGIAAKDGQEMQTEESAQARRRVELMQAGIRTKLVPLLFRLAFSGQSSDRKRQSKADNLHTSDSGRFVGDTTTTSEERKKSAGEGHIRPAVVAVLLLVLRLLPAAEFGQQLPKLVRAVVFNLRSREREVRRKARAALVALAENLGPSCFAFLVSETSLLLQQRQSRKQQQGNDSASNAALGTSAQAFYRPVLLFTLHAMLSRLVQQLSQPPEFDAGASQHVAETKEDEDCGMPDDSSKPAASAGHTRGVSPGEIDEAIPLLLPLIAEVSVLIASGRRRCICCGSGCRRSARSVYRVKGGGGDQIGKTRLPVVKRQYFLRRLCGDI